MKLVKFIPVEHDLDSLKRLQALPLEVKIKISLSRIRDWYEHFKGNVFVSYSGGKDSTVLLHLVRSIYPSVPAVFVNTGLEYPEVVEQVKNTENVIWLRPKMNFKQVLEKYGVCFPSKDVAEYIYYARKGKKWALDRLNGVSSNGEPSQFRQDRFGKFKHLLNAPFKISSKCCYVMKESPLNRFQTAHKLQGMVATLASESLRRRNAYLVTGCNSYDSFYPSSKPLSFWLEQDILRYIQSQKLQIASIYGDIIEKNNRLYLTGEDRTGCMFCLIGCHLDGVNRFEKMRRTHPSRYKFCMESLNLSEILDWLHIKY